MTKQVLSFFCRRPRPLLASLLAAGALTLGGVGAANAEYPERPVQVVVPYGPGSADVVPRIATAAVSERTGANFVIENKPGAGGLIGTQYVLRQPADGYHVLMAATNNLAINQFVFASHDLDPLNELRPVAKLVTVPMIVAVNAELPVHTLDEFIAYAKEQGDNLTFSSPSVGTPPQIAAQSFLHTLGLEGRHIPYKGGVAMATAVASGDVQFAVVAYSTLQSVIDAGRVRPLAVVNAERLDVLPDVPTVSEAGQPELLNTVLPNWWAMTARAETPDAEVQWLASQLEAALAEESLQQTYHRMGMVVTFEGPEQMARQLPAEAETWRKTVERLGIRVD